MSQPMIAAGLSRIGVVDLLVGAAVLISVVGALRRGGGLGGVVAAGVGVTALSWLVVTAAVVWGPPSIAAAAERSAFSDTLPPPTHALAELGIVPGPPDHVHPSAHPHSQSPTNEETR